MSASVVNALRSIGLAPDALDRIGEPVEITGELSRRGDLMMLAIDPQSVRGI